MAIQTLYLVDLSIDTSDPSKASNGTEKLEFQYVPTELAYNREASLATIDVVGRNNPLQQWTGGNTSMSFSLDFYAEDEAREEVIKKVRWLQALTYQKQNGSTPLVKLVFGDMFLSEIWRVKTANVKYSNFHPAKNFKPCQANVEITLQLDSRDERGNPYDFTAETFRKLK